MTADEKPLESLSNAITKYTPAESSAVSGMSEQDQAFAALKNNTFGILEDDGTIEEKMIRLINLLPMAFHVMDEARSTIARLRDENEKLRGDAGEIQT